MQSELDKIYEEEYEERLEKRFSMGLSEASIRIAKKMLSDGLSIELISKYTGLSSGEIQAI